MAGPFFGGCERMKIHRNTVDFPFFMHRTHTVVEHEYIVPHNITRDTVALSMQPGRRLRIVNRADRPIRVILLGDDGAECETMVVTDD